MTKSLPPKSLVLYADDDADDRELIADAFEQYASVIDLLLFEEGASLLQYIEQLSPLQPNPCLIILDVNMPRVDGKWALHKIRMMEAYKDTPVVLFTTSTLPSEAAFAEAYQAGFVTKPLHTKQIDGIIHNLLDHCAGEVKEKIKQLRSR